MSVIRSFFTVSAYTLISRITGYARDMLIAAQLGTSPLAEAYLVAFKLPNFFRRLFAEGAFSAAFVPMFSGRLTGDGRTEALAFAERIYGVLLAALVIFTAIMLVLLPYFMYILAPGFVNKPDLFELATTLTRITFPYLTLISIVSLLSGILNSFGRFAAVAAAPILLNLCTIGALLWLPPYVETKAHALAYGLLAAGVLQLLWLYGACKRANLVLFPKMPKLTPEVRQFFRRFGPGALGAGVTQINLWVDIMIGTFISGAIAFLYYADRITQLPLSLIGTAMGVALLPHLAAAIRADKWDEAITTQNRALELVAFFSLPATAALMTISYPITSVLFERGEFDSASASASAAAMIAYAAGLPAFIGVKIFSTSFFALGDTKTPVKVAIFCVLANIVFNGIFIFAFKALGWMPHIGIALATTTSAWINTFMLSQKLVKKGHFRFDARMRQKAVSILISCAIMCVVLLALQYVLWDYLKPNPQHLQIPAFLALSGIGVLSYFIAAHFLNAFDKKEILGYLKRKPKPKGAEAASVPADE